MTIPVPYRVFITLAFVGLVVVLSVTPGKSQAGDSVFVWLVANTPTLLQKILHIACYAAIAALWVWTLEVVGSPTLRLALALLLSIGLGATLEWYQTQVPGRFGTMTDVLLNTAGALLGLLLTIFLL